MKFGERRMVKPELPNLYGAGILNAAVLNH
jgi:hypothetical protein